MHDDILEQFESILDSILIIHSRFSSIKQPDDFVNSETGTLILDGISMRLQYIGEQIKNIDKIDKSVLEKYNEIKWSEIMKLRDIISHHYDKVDHEEIYNICTDNIPHLQKVIEKIIKEN